MKFSRVLIALFGFAVSMLAADASATFIPEPLFKFTTSYNVDINNFNIGNEFTTGPQLFVSGIGAFIAPIQITSGLTNTEYNAYLYADDNSTLLASAVIPIGTPVDVQSFAYVPLAYTLTAGTSYVLTSRATLTTPSSSAYTYSLVAANPTGVWGLGTTFVQNWYIAGFAPPTSTNTAYKEFMGGNLLVADQAPVPEPSTLALLGLGVVGLAAKTRRRRAVQFARSVVSNPQD